MGKDWQGQPSGSRTLSGTPEHPVPPLTGQHQLPPELPRGLLAPPVHAPARVADQAITRAVAQAMPAVPNLRHAPLLRDLQVTFASGGQYQETV